MGISSFFLLLYVICPFCPNTLNIQCNLYNLYVEENMSRI